MQHGRDNQPKTGASGAAPPDQVVRGLLRDRSIRAVAAITTGVLAESTRRHGAVGAAAVALGRASTAGLLLATLTKDRERVTVQVLGDGPLGAVIVDADAQGNVRAYLKDPGVALPALPGMRVSLGRAMGTEGVVRVARDLGLKDIVSGQTSLTDGEIDTDIEDYLASSEQIASALACDVLLDADLEVAVSGGVLLQSLPGSEDIDLLDELRERLRGGALTRALAQSPRDAAALLEAVLGEHADQLAVLDARPVRFSCPCSKKRAAATLALLGAEDLGRLAREEGGATVTCEFCRAEHRFKQDDLERLRAEATGTDGRS